MSELNIYPENEATPENQAAAIELEYGGLNQLEVTMQIMGTAFSSIYGESWNEDQCRSMLSLPGTQLIIARCGKKPCGFAITREVAREEELLMIAVDPQYQNQGIGLTILKRLIADAVKNRITAVFLEVRSNNPAQSLYQKLGFQKIGLRHAYYTGETKEKFDAITYKKSL